MIPISSVKEYAKKLPKDQQARVIEAIIPTDCTATKKLQKDLSIGRKKIQNASENRKNVLSDTPRKRHASSGKSKISFEQAQKVFEFFISNSTPITGSNSESKILVAPFIETPSERNSYLLRLYSDYGIEAETRTYRGKENLYFFHNSHVVKNNFDDLHESFCNSEFEISFYHFIQFAPFFVIKYSNQWQSMCHC